MQKRIISNELSQFIRALKTEVLPFDSYVSRKHLKDEVDISRTHNEMDIKVMRGLKNIVYNHLPKCIPLLGNAGSGKTHYYWSLKDTELKNELDYKEYLNSKKFESSEDFHDVISEKDDFIRWRCIYIPSPPAPIRMPLHILTCMIDELGIEVLENVSFNLINKFGKSSVSGKLDERYYKRLMGKSLSYFGGIYSDILKNFITYGSVIGSSEKQELAERWLLGETLSKEELEELGVKLNIESDDICFAMIKLISEMYSFPMIFFFDEMELMERVHGKEAEIRLWEIIKKLFNESHNILFITTCLLDVWERIECTLDDTILSRFSPIVKLRPFNFKDLLECYIQSMKLFWLRTLKTYPEDILFPFSIDTLRDMFEKTDGNPRKNIKLISLTLQKFIDGDFSLDLISNNKWSWDEELGEKLFKTQDILKNKSEENEKISDFSNIDNLEIVDPQFDLNSEEINAEIQDLENNLKFGLNQDGYLGNEDMSNYDQEALRLGKFLPVCNSKSAENKIQTVKIIINHEIYYFDIAPNIIYSTITSILRCVSEINKKHYRIEMEPKFQINKLKKSIGLTYHLIKERVGFEIPNVRNFNSKNLIGAYHSLIKITEAIKRGFVDKCVIIIPKDALIKGKQTVDLLSNYENDISIIEITNNQAKKFIEEWNKIENKKNKNLEEEIHPLIYQFIIDNPIINSIFDFISKDLYEEIVI